MRHGQRVETFQTEFRPCYHGIIHTKKYRPLPVNPALAFKATFSWVIFIKGNNQLLHRTYVVKGIEDFVVIPDTKSADIKSNGNVQIPMLVLIKRVKTKYLLSRKVSK